MDDTIHFFLCCLVSDFILINLFIFSSVWFSVKHLKIEKNNSPNVSHFESVTEKGKRNLYFQCLFLQFCNKNLIKTHKLCTFAEFEQTEGHLQSNVISVSSNKKMFKIIDCPFES